jgi:myo-inositol-hexaphosphate 3-phosphohydrolase
MKIDFTKIISTTNKFEGLTVYKQDGKQITFYCAETKDNNENESDIFKLTLDLK